MENNLTISPAYAEDIESKEQANFNAINFSGGSLNYISLSLQAAMWEGNAFIANHLNCTLFSSLTNKKVPGNNLKNPLGGSHASRKLAEVHLYWSWLAHSKTWIQKETREAQA